MTVQKGTPMTQDELVDALLACCEDRIGDVATASRIDGEPAIGVEMTDGAEYFITVESA